MSKTEAEPSDTSCESLPEHSKTPALDSTGLL